MKEGEEFRILCETDANPTVDKIVWSKKTDASFEQKQAELHISGVSVEDAGIYICSATNHLTPTDSNDKEYRASKDIELKVLCKCPITTIGLVS